MEIKGKNKPTNKYTHTHTHSSIQTHIKFKFQKIFIFYESIYAKVLGREFPHGKKYKRITS